MRLVSALAGTRPGAPVRVLQTVPGSLTADLTRVPDPLLPVWRGVVGKSDVCVAVRPDLDLEEVEQRSVTTGDAQDPHQADVTMVDAARVRTDRKSTRL